MTVSISEVGTYEELQSNMASHPLSTIWAVYDVPGFDSVETFWIPTTVRSLVVYVQQCSVYNVVSIKILHIHLTGTQSGNPWVLINCYIHLLKIMRQCLSVRHVKTCRDNTHCKKLHRSSRSAFAGYCSSILGSNRHHYSGIMDIRRPTIKRIPDGWRVCGLV